MTIKDIYVFKKINNNHKHCKGCKINVGLYNALIVYRNLLLFHTFMAKIIKS